MALIFQNKYVFLFLPYKVLNQQEKNLHGYHAWIKF